MTQTHGAVFPQGVKAQGFNVLAVDQVAVIDIKEVGDHTAEAGRTAEVGHAAEVGHTVGAKEVRTPVAEVDPGLGVRGVGGLEAVADH